MSRAGMLYTGAARVARVEEFLFRSTELGHTRLDRENGVIRGVCLIQKGVVAEGHELHVDDVCLGQMFQSAVERGKVPVKVNHKSGLDNLVGHLTNFRIEGDKLRGDLHLLTEHERYGHLMQAAERQPETFGMSVAFRGVPEERGSKKYARCEKLKACDIVADPAACPEGLFSEGGGVDNGRRGMAKLAFNDDGTIAFSSPDVAGSEVGAALNLLAQGQNQILGWIGTQFSAGDGDDGLEFDDDDDDEFYDGGGEEEDDEGEGYDGLIPIEDLTEEQLASLGIEMAPAMAIPQHFSRGSGGGGGRRETEFEDPRIAQLESVVAQLLAEREEERESYFSAAQDEAIESVTARATELAERARELEIELEATHRALELSHFEVEVNEEGEPALVELGSRMGRPKSRIEEVALEAARVNGDGNPYTYFEELRKRNPRLLEEYYQMRGMAL